MHRRSLSRLIGAFGIPLLALNLGGEAVARSATSLSRPLGDVSTFRVIAVDTLTIVNTGNLTVAKARIKDLETIWDKAEVKLRPRNPERWQTVDKAIDSALAQLRADMPQKAGAKDALQRLLATLDQSNQTATGAPGDAAALESPRLSVTDIIAAAEKLQAGATVLDVSFEPKHGQPAYAVRTYANGKVWDGLFDGTSGQATDNGTVIRESALDAEDKAELAALKRAKITLREAIALAEKANPGRTLNAGLEQVRGRVVWEVLIQDAKRPEQVHIDPITGRIL